MEEEEEEKKPSRLFFVFLFFFFLGDNCIGNYRPVESLFAHANEGEGRKRA